MVFCHGVPPTLSTANVNRKLKNWLRIGMGRPIRSTPPKIHLSRRSMQTIFFPVFAKGRKNPRKRPIPRNSAAEFGHPIRGNILRIRGSDPRNIPRFFSAPIFQSANLLLLDLSSKHVFLTCNMLVTRICMAMHVTIHVFKRTTKMHKSTDLCVA